MDCIAFLEMLLGLTHFKEIFDGHGNGYVLFRDSAVETVGCIEDKTAFEAMENHVHLFEDIGGRQFLRLQKSMREVGALLLSALCSAYPDKRFVVCVGLTRGDSMVIRFHQQWNGEKPYYAGDIDTDDEKLIILASETIK